jgi:ABC-type polysaccharide/polyol phosphate transport system ATPase subunit
VSSIIVKNVTLDYPIYGVSQKSFRQTIFSRTGGLIRRESGGQRHVVVRALENISFELQHGDRLGLIGHNGAGKSTLLRLLAGVFEPVSGEIITEGRISPLFTAAPGIDPDDTGYENIRTCGTYLGMSNDEIVQKTPEIAEFCELGDYLSLPVRTYSAGMMTRLAFAIATSIHPDILLLDEGLGAADAQFTARAEKRMSQLIDRSSILVFASHSNELIKSICNKAALMEKGQIVAFGSIDEIIQAYHDRTH